MNVFSRQDFSRYVSILDTLNGKTLWIELSNFCSQCGHPRGDPELVTRLIDGRSYTFHQWNNQCPHIDTESSLLLEVDAQCAIEKCTLLRSAYMDPYCGADCTHLSVVEMVARMGGAVSGLDDVVIMINYLHNIMDNFDVPIKVAKVIRSELDGAKGQLAMAQQLICSAGILVESSSSLAAGLRPILQI